MMQKTKNNFEHNSRSKIILHNEYETSLENSHIFRKTIFLEMAVFMDIWTYIQVLSNTVWFT
jgi:hypothetical protein